MPPKTKQPAKRSKKDPKDHQSPALAAEEEEELIVDDPLQPAAEFEGGPVDDDAEVAPVIPEPARPKAKKAPARVPHKEIEDYPFTPEQVQEMVDFLKQHPQMYNRKHREFCNARAKVNMLVLLFL